MDAHIGSDNDIPVTLAKNDKDATTTTTTTEAVIIITSNKNRDKNVVNLVVGSLG